MIDQTLPSAQDSPPIARVRREPTFRGRKSSNSPSSQRLYSPTGRFYRLQQRRQLDQRQRRKVASRAALAELQASYGQLFDISGSLTTYLHGYRPPRQSDAAALASDWRKVGDSLRTAIHRLETESTT